MGVQKSRSRRQAVIHKDIFRKNSRARLDRISQRITTSRMWAETRAIGEIQKELPVCFMQKNPERERTGWVRRGRVPGIDGGQPGMMPVLLIPQNKVMIPGSNVAGEVHHQRGITMIRMPERVQNEPEEVRNVPAGAKHSLAGMPEMVQSRPVNLPEKVRYRMPDSRKADRANRKDMKRRSAGWMRLKRS